MSEIHNNISQKVKKNPKTNNILFTERLQHTEKKTRKKGLKEKEITTKFAIRIKISNTHTIQTNKKI